MRTLHLILVFSLLLFSCSNNPEQNIEHINGYWEIESVTFPDGTKKEYKVNQSIDYITINDSLKGFRKKMTPNFGGTYKTSKDAETVILKIENDSLNVYYSTKFANWKETILMVSKAQLKIVNKNNNVYLYKRFTPIIIE